MIKSVREYLDILQNRLPENEKDILLFEKSQIIGRKGDWMTTYTGGMFWLLDPRPSEVCIEDIAHALSLICRYNGHIKQFYSVAQHCVLVSKHCDGGDALYGLLHDSAEAYTGDIISPLKKLLPNYKVIEERILTAVYKKFGLKNSDKRKQRIKVWDNILLATEVKELIPYKYLNWKMVEPHNIKIRPCWSPKKAERLFLKRFNELYGKGKK